MDCCELTKIALYVIAGAFGVILVLLAMFFGYNLKLDKRTFKLEKKNGKEQKQIDELKNQLAQLKQDYAPLPTLPKAKTTP